MKKRSSFELRNLFLEYFRQQQHLIEPGVPLVPVNDPSLLWINSGVSALKKYFDGTIKLEIPRIANSQRSIRTNDIENIGLTARHHTMFEMLGNFSIGDYFKEGAIKYAWEFLTSKEWIGFDVDKLYVSVYSTDDEAYNIWRDVIGLDESRIFRLEGNFWEIGSGPSGPNSEIFYDRGIAYDPDNIGIKLLAEDLDNDRYIEVWNLVFSQYNAEEGKDRSEYQELPQKNIDTGMGLERLASLVQGVETNFETDLFMPIIEATGRLATKPYAGANKKAYKIIADHLRALVFALADGAMFANEGRGYVLRRLLRRASRYGLEIGIDEPFLYQLVSVVVKLMSDYYDYLPEHEALVSKLIKGEEERFHKTLNSGLILFNEVKANAKGTTISGDDAFKLYDTYGFPIELSQEIAREANLSIDMERFNELMALQKERGRAAFNEDSNFSKQSVDLLAYTQESKFIGYDKEQCEAKVIGLFKDGVKVETLTGLGEVVFDKTVFYAESGGQINDRGTISCNGINYEVLKVRKAPEGQHLHQIEVQNIKLGATAFLKINVEKRKLTACNHTATHLLHQALKDVVGKHVNQAGSFVNEDYLRFDFNHYEKVSAADLACITKQVNEEIFKGQKTIISWMSLEEAKKKHAMALFDDKYGDIVRVIEIPNISIELCGGTHVKEISEIGLFKIEKEESVGSGIRRITARTSKGAYELLDNYLQQLNEVQDLVKAKDLNMVVERTKQIKEELITSTKELNKLKSQLLKNSSKVEAITLKDVELYALLLNDVRVNEMKDVVSNYQNQHPNGLVIAYNDQNYVIGLGAGLLVKDYRAKDFALLLNKAFAGKGGGKDDKAQGGISKKITEAELINLVENNI